MLESVTRFLGEAQQSITLVGGGGQSQVWAQIFADTLNLTVKLTRDPIQANARGAAFLAGIGIGALSFEDIPSCVPIDHVFQPKPRNVEIYAERYAQFRAAYRQLKSFYRGAFKALGPAA
jgi:xylulokinase